MRNFPLRILNTKKRSFLRTVQGRVHFSHDSLKGNSSMIDLEDIGNVKVEKHLCVGAGDCRTFAPSVFKAGDDSYTYSVASKPIETLEEFNGTRRAVHSCPKEAIRWIKLPKIKGGTESPLWQGFPCEIEDGVFDVGYPSKRTFGAHSFLIVRPKGNILIDCPSPNPELIKAIENLGGVKYLFITHKDHANHHSEWKAATNCTRIIHSRDVYTQSNSVFESTDSCEIKLEGFESSYISDDKDLKIIPIPGHTEGSIALLYANKLLFTGDSLCWSERTKALIALRHVCWYDWKIQAESLKKFLGEDFQWVLPGHGERYHTHDLPLMKKHLQECISRMAGMD